MIVLESKGAVGEAWRHQEGRFKHWAQSIDDLVDYIRVSAHQNLTLTDLERQSHYSARQLQNLFRERFDCTPMQFVRRQRLSTAMEKLQTAAIASPPTSAATSIASSGWLPPWCSGPRGIVGRPRSLSRIAPPPLLRRRPQICPDPSDSNGSGR
ncbi:MAG: AraC family transcriptional regulator [Cyanobacteriota bacterium]